MRKPANDEGMGARDHRVIDHGSWLGIHEVYYDEQGTPTAFMPEALAVIVEAGEGPREVRATLELVRGALERPVLNAEDFR
jgi:hypothetical protein